MYISLKYSYRSGGQPITIFGKVAYRSVHQIPDENLIIPKAYDSRLAEKGYCKKIYIKAFKEIIKDIKEKQYEFEIYKSFIDTYNK